MVDKLILLTVSIVTMMLISPMAAAQTVSGSIDLDVSMTPEGTQTESVNFFFDLQSNLMINFTLSGVTLSADLGFGTTGLEFGILGIRTNIGALSLFDQYIFAAPFGCTAFPNGVGNGSDVGVIGQCPGPQVFVIGDGDADGVIDGAVGLVQERMELELNIAGITITNLSVFEDVDFPDIQGSNSATGATDDHEHDHFGRGAIYDLSEADSFVDNQSPTLGFGDVIRISGQTVSGITVTGQTDICINTMRTFYIKKRSFPGEVNKGCTAAFGDPGNTPIESGTKTPLLFEKELLIIEGIELGGITIDLETLFLPNQPISSNLTAALSVLGLADVKVELSSDNLLELSLDEIVISLDSANLSIQLTDTGGDLGIDTTETTLSLMLNPDQNPADLVITLETDTSGITEASFALGLTRGILEFDTTTEFQGSGSLAWTSTSLSLSANLDFLAFVLETGFTPAGIGITSISLGSSW